VRPESSVHFLRLGALQIRRELVDLARHHFGPNGAAAHAHFGEPPDGTDSSSSASGGQENQPPDDRGDGPSTLAEWTEFHEAVSAVPEELMAVVDLLLYQGLSQPQVARELGVDVRTVRRRWRAARRALAKWLADGPPGGKGHE
jgi:RNA polymerase sigma-70 factor (ECF subfamily)